MTSSCITSNKKGEEKGRVLHKRNFRLTNFVKRNIDGFRRRGSILDKLLMYPIQYLFCSLTGLLHVKLGP